ncbi:hypothetical protein AMECASPLE_033937 [Ameca splendens]|uniref:Uncharacterized protein n=1 Tax=Ameca splendens TaxID=208324 RepID=A0ABV1AE16_9TELE
MLQPYWASSFQLSNIENKRDGSPLKQTSKASNLSPVHRAYQRTEISKIQEKFSSAAPAAQDAKKPAANGLVVQMEQDKETEEKTHDRMRIETAELVNGDLESEDQVDSPHHHTDRTGTESHAENEDNKKTTETVQQSEEGSLEHKL